RRAHPFPIVARSLAVAAALAFLTATIAHSQEGREEAEAPAETPSEAPSEVETESPLALRSVEILPEAPGPETLCRLSVEIVNRADEPVTAFGFDVTVAGHPLPVYENQLFLKVVPPGATVELALYNFWSSETGRPAPAGGEMPVQVTLREARWVKLGEEEGTEVWELQGEVPGLPVSARTVVELKE
ncbi:MAG: hypothetical protein PVG07_12040, partial [Acidobacteriota bacterium]